MKNIHTPPPSASPSSPSPPPKGACECTGSWSRGAEEWHQKLHAELAAQTAELERLKMWARNVVATANEEGNLHACGFPNTAHAIERLKEAALARSDSKSSAAPKADVSREVAPRNCPGVYIPPGEKEPSGTPEGSADVGPAKTEDTPASRRGK